MKLDDIKKSNVKNLDPYYNKNEIEFCEYCGGNKFYEKTVDRIDYTVTEFEVICKDCGAKVNYWQFGFYYNMPSPNYLKLKQKRDRKLKLEKIIIKRNK